MHIHAETHTLHTNMLAHTLPAESQRAETVSEQRSTAQQAARVCKYDWGSTFQTVEFKPLQRSHKGRHKNKIYPWLWSRSDIDRISARNAVNTERRNTSVWFTFLPRCLWTLWSCQYHHFWASSPLSPSIVFLLDNKIRWHINDAQGGIRVSSFHPEGVCHWHNLIFEGIIEQRKCTF